MVVYRVGEYSRALVDSLVDIGASLTNLLVVRIPCNLPTIITRLVTVKLSPCGAGAKYVYLRFGTIPVFDGIQHLVSPTPMTDPGVGVIVTLWR